MPQQVDILKEKVGRYIEDLMGPYETNQRGEMHFRWGSTRVFVRCTPLGDEEAVVYITIPLLFGLEGTPELFKHVAMHADDWHFGHLSLAKNSSDERFTLWLTHTLLGDYLDVEELKTALAMMSKTADQLDDELKETFGGDRYHES